jgi:hypothetical protein
MKNLKVLFLHFPKDNFQIEGLGLPTFFSKAGHTSYLAFEKGSRNFFCRMEDHTLEDIEKEQLFDINFDIIVGKSSSFITYDRRYFQGNDDAFRVNIIPMGITANKRSVHFPFKDDQLLKPPQDDMQVVFEKYAKYEDRENIIFIPASIGTDKNQLEFIELVDPGLVEGYRVVFAGPVRSRDYLGRMATALDKKSIKWELLGHISKREVAEVMKRSKVVALTTDPRPGQPYDPSPRVIHESVRAGTPFFISDLVLCPSIFRDLGFVYCHGGRSSFNTALKTMLESDLASVSNRLFSMGEEKLTMNFACQKTHDDIFLEYKKFKEVE